MSLNGDILGLAMKAALDSLTIPQDREQTAQEKDDMWKALGASIVDHFTANAVIDTTVSTTVNTIVATPDTLTGTGTGPGTGTGVGTIS